MTECPTKIEINIDGIWYTQNDSIPQAATAHNGPIVLVRSPGAGVHYGTLIKRDGEEVTLANARNVAYWTGANTLREMSLYGVKPGSKISEPVPETLILGVKEVLPVQQTALPNLKSGWPTR